MPSIIYFASLAMDALWRSVERTPIGKLGQRAIGGVMLLVAGLVAYLNGHIYFVQQANDNAVWLAHNAVETLVAGQMNNLNPDITDCHISPLLKYHPVIEFLVPDYQDVHVFLPTESLPLRESGDKPVALFFDEEQAVLADLPLKYYPNAKQTVSHNLAGDPVLYSVLVPPEAIREIQGLSANYWQGNTPEGDPLVTRTEPEIESAWPSGAPVAPPFVAQWDGVLYVPEFGEYEFLFRSQGPATLWLDGRPALLNGDRGEHRHELTLPQGSHSLDIEAAGGEGELRLAIGTTSGSAMPAAPSPFLD